MKPIQIKKDDGVDVAEVSNTASIQNLSRDALVDVEAYGVNPLDSEFVRETYNKSYNSNFHQPWEWNISYFMMRDKIQVRS
jgi:hypothetical protein